MRRLLTFFAFMLVLGSAVPSFAQGYSPDRDRDGGRRDSLRVLSAWYGVGNRACDAERAVERMCGNRSSCTVPVTNRLCGDPAPQVVKVLTVTYQCRGRGPRTITRGEGGYLGLRCDSRRDDRR